MLRMGLGLAAAVLNADPALLRHLNGGYVTRITCPRWLRSRDAGTTRNPAGEVLFPGRMWRTGATCMRITLPPPFGSLIDSDSLPQAKRDSTASPENWRPPVVIPFFSFRIMVELRHVDAGGCAWLVPI